MEYKEGGVLIKQCRAYQQPCANTTVLKRCQRHPILFSSPQKKEEEEEGGWMV